MFYTFVHRCIIRSQLGVGDLRLFRGPNSCEGHLQVLVPNNGQLQWSSACDRGFGVDEMQVACRQIGCPAGNPERRTVERYYQLISGDVGMHNAKII